MKNKIFYTGIGSNGKQYLNIIKKFLNIIKKFKDDYLYNKGFILKDWIKFKGAELM